MSNDKVGDLGCSPSSTNELVLNLVSMISLLNYFESLLPIKILVAVTYSISGAWMVVKINPLEAGQLYKYRLNAEI